MWIGARNMLEIIREEGRGAADLLVEIWKVRMLLSRQGLKSFLPSCIAAPLPQIARRTLLDHEPRLLLLIADSNATAVPSEYDILCQARQDQAYRSTLWLEKRFPFFSAHVSVHCRVGVIITYKPSTLYTCDTHDPLFRRGFYCSPILRLC